MITDRKLSTLVRLLEISFEQATHYRATNARWLRSHSGCHGAAPPVATFVQALIQAA